MTGTVNVVNPFINIVSVKLDGNGCTITGTTAPNTAITLRSAPDLITQFQNPTPVTSGADGAFTFIDATASADVPRFYRATDP